MADRNTTITRTLNESLGEPGEDSQQRLEKALARAKAQVAVLDYITLVLARLWVVLAALLAPVFAWAANRHAQPSTLETEELGHE